MDNLEISVAPHLSLSVKDGWSEQEQYGTFFPPLTLPKQGF